MRLWDYKLIPYLPDLQLKAQWRELNSIFKKQDKHILINYIYEYPKLDLYHYTKIVIEEMQKRGIKISVKAQNNANGYFKDCQFIYSCDGFNGEPFRNHHTNEYLLICFFNLHEKYIRGQKGFSTETYIKLYEYVNGFYNLDLIFKRNLKTYGKGE